MGVGAPKWPICGFHHFHAEISAKNQKNPKNAYFSSEKIGVRNDSKYIII
jgi:hypothetical protein